MRRARRLGAVLCSLLLLLSVLSACGQAPRRIMTYYEYFDTVTNVIGYGSENDFNAACAIVEDILREYHRLSDIYHEYAEGNNACTLNLAAGQAPVALDDRLLDVLDYGKEMYALTNGYCNIAMGAVLSLWHTCRDAALAGEGISLPDMETLRAAAEHTSIDDLVIDRAAGTAFLRDPSMSLDLGAVAKGYATECAAQALKEAGFTGYVLSVGGNDRAVGAKPDGTAWVIGIQDPTLVSEDAYRLKVDVSDGSLVTSGSYQRYFSLDGVRYHHIISPDTLMPENAFLSVTVSTESSALADALSTAIFNMPLEEGLEYVNQMDGVEVCWILSDASIVFSDGFEGYE